MPTIWLIISNIWAHFSFSERKIVILSPNLTLFLNEAMNLIPIITDYLKAHRRLVVPQLGAFIRKSDGDEVVFSEMLKRDDGQLRSLLMEQGMGEIEASGVIDRFIFELRHAVTEGSVYQAEGLGVFALGENGTIRFRYLPHLPETAGESNEDEADSVQEPERLSDAVQDEELSTNEEPAVSDSLTPVEAGMELENPTEPISEEILRQPEEEVQYEVPTSQSEGESEEVVAPELELSADEKRSRIKQLIRFADEHPREHRSSSQPRRQDPSVRGLRYGKPQKSTDAYTYVNSTPSRRPDTFIILAVLAVVIALGAILYGYWNDRRKERLEQEYLEQPFEPTLSPMEE